MMFANAMVIEHIKASIIVKKNFINSVSKKVNIYLVTVSQLESLSKSTILMLLELLN